MSIQFGPTSLFAAGDGISTPLFENDEQKKEHYMYLETEIHDVRREKFTPCYKLRCIKQEERGTVLRDSLRSTSVFATDGIAAE